MYLRYCISILSILFIFNNSYGQCSTNTEVDIVDLVPTSQNIIIDGATNDNLSGNQALVGILLEFEHSQVGDLTIELTSPAGQSIVLVGPIGSFGNTSLTDWEVLFIPCANPANPDAGFSDTWSNNQEWGSLGDYTGSYYPFSGCLEDFNSGSINGNWNLLILDNNLFDEGKLLNTTLFFADPEGLDCDNCTADAGAFDTNELFVCKNNPDNIDLQPTYAAELPGLENDFLYIIRQNDTILDVSSELNLSSYDEGEYSICGISVLNSDISTLESMMSMGFDALSNNLNGQSPTICASINETCVTAFLSQGNIEVDLDVTICAGDTYNLGDESFDTAGEYEVVIPQSTGCDSIYNLDLTLSNIDAQISSSSTTLDCSSPSITLNSSPSTTNANTEILWTSTGGNVTGNNQASSIEVNEAGTYTLTLTDGNCVSTTTIEIFANSNAAELTIVGGSITCTSPNVDIDLESNITISSVDWVGPNGFTNTNEDITVDEPGTYTATVETNNGCVSVKSVIINEAGSVPVVSLSAEEITCGEPLVNIAVSASSGSLQYEWTGPNGFTYDEQSPIVGEAGVYEVTVTDNFGCSDVFQIEVMGDANVFEYDINVENIICPEGRGFVEVIIDNPNAQITWEFPNGNIDNGISINPNSEGTYEVTILSDGCEVVEEIEVLEDFAEIPSFQVVQDNPIACMDQNGTLSINVLSGLNAIDSIAWIGPEGYLGSTDEIITEFAGNYTLRVFSTAGCNFQEIHELEYEVSTIEVEIVDQSINCVFDSGFLAAISNLDLDYTWEDAQGNITNDSIVTSTVESTYELTVEDENGCFAKYISEITIDTLPRNIALIKSNDLSCEENEATLSFAFFRFIDYEWLDSNKDFIANTNAIAIQEPGEYFIAVVDKSSLCIDTASIIVELDTISPDLQIQDQGFDCLNDNLLLQVESSTQNVTYSWTGPDGFSSNQKSPLATVAGEYTVTVLGPNGCTSSKTIEVTDDGSLPNLEANSSNNLDCINTQTTLTGSTSSPGASFQWIGPNNVFDQASVVVEVPGEYVLIATGSNGCSDSTTLVVPFTGDLPEFEAVSDTLFCGETELMIDIQENTPDVTYEWTGPNGYTSMDIQNIVTQEGEYILTGTATNNCVTVDTAFIVIDNEDPIIALNELLDTLDCVTEELPYSFNSDKDYNSIEWASSNSFNSTDSSVVLTEAGDYSLTVVANNNCETTFNFTIEEDLSEPVISFENEDLNCDNQKADILITNDDAGSTYSWIGPNFDSQLQDVSVEEEGDYTLIVTGSNGCTFEQIINIESDFEMPDLSASNDTLDCTDNPILLTAESTTEDVVIQWLGPNGFDSLGFNVLADMEGTYFVTATGLNGCSTQLDIELFNTPVFPDVSLLFSNTINCEFDTAVISAEVPANVVETEWLSESGFTTDLLEFETGEAGKFIFSATGDNGCITIDSIVVEIDTLYPDVVVSQVGRLMCDVNSISINGEGSAVGAEFSYEWKTDDGVITFGSNTLNPVIEGEGTYLLAIENDENGCINTETIVIEEEESTLESMDLIFNKQTCSDIMDGEIIIQNVVGGIQPLRYAIEGSSFTDSTDFNGLFAGDYLVSVKDSFGCVLDSLVTLEEKFQVTIDLGDDLDIFLGEEVTISADINFPLNQVTGIIWQPSNIVDCEFCTEFTYIPGNNTQITASVIDENGCIDQDQLIIRVDDEIKLYVPNIFTPNDDGVNDQFSIPVSPNVSLINSFRIYDRWGTEVWADANFIPGEGSTWDGRHLNRKVAAGVYFFVGELVMVNGEIRTTRGNITVTR